MLGLLVLLASSPSLALEVTPTVDGCGLALRVEGALRRLAPMIELRRSPAEDTLRLSLAEGGGALLLTLVDPAGPGIAARRLPNPPDACSATADGIALIIERYLRGLGRLPDLPNPPAEVPPPSIPPPPPPPPAPLAVTATRTPDREEGWPLSMYFALFGEAAGPSPLGWSLGLGADLRAQLGRVGLEVGLRIRAPRTQDVLYRDRVLGTLRVQSLDVRAGLAGCWALLGEVCLVAHAGLERAAGEVSGRLFQQRPDAQVRPLLGLSLHHEAIFLGPLGLRAGVTAAWRPGPPSFSIEGSGSSPVEESGFTLMFALGAALQIL